MQRQHRLSSDTATFVKCKLHGFFAVLQADFERSVMETEPFGLTELSMVPGKGDEATRAS
jgi:hypothetical protein